ncbi:hypothetical protein [Fimbriimonas ginsengisoli]|nr:hypothetical protein [Fimbriimonas ginsengisoli]
MPIFIVLTVAAAISLAQGQARNTATPTVEGLPPTFTGKGLKLTNGWFQRQGHEVLRTHLEATITQRPHDLWDLSVDNLLLSSIPSVRSSSGVIAEFKNGRATLDDTSRVPLLSGQRAASIVGTVQRYREADESIVLKDVRLVPNPGRRSRLWLAAVPTGTQTYRTPSGVRITFLPPPKEHLDANAIVDTDGPAERFSLYYRTEPNEFESVHLSGSPAHPVDGKVDLWLMNPTAMFSDPGMKSDVERRNRNVSDNRQVSRPAVNIPSSITFHRVGNSMVVPEIRLTLRHHAILESHRWRFTGPIREIKR